MLAWLDAAGEHLREGECGRGCGGKHPSISLMGSVGLSSVARARLSAGRRRIADCRDVAFSQGMGSRGMSRAAGTVSRGA